MFRNFRNFLTSFVFLAIFMFAVQLFAQPLMLSPDLNLLKKRTVEVTLDTTITNDPFVYSCNQKERGQGNVFTATVQRDIFTKGKLIVPAGAKAYGKVTGFYYEKQKESRIDLELTGITLADGTVLPIKAVPYWYYKNNKKPGILAMVGNIVGLSIFYGAFSSLISPARSLDVNRNMGFILGGGVGLLNWLENKKTYVASPIVMSSTEPLYFWVEKKK